MQSAMEDNEMKAVLGMEIQESFINMNLKGGMNMKEGERVPLGMNCFSKGDKKKHQSKVCTTLFPSLTSCFVKTEQD